MSIFKNRTVVGVLCILLSLLICFGVTPLFNSAVSEKAEIVRVVKEITAGDETATVVLSTLGTGAVDGRDGEVRPGTVGLTSALGIFEAIGASWKPLP